MAADKPRMTLDEYFNFVSYPEVAVSPDGNAVVVATSRADWDQQTFRSDLWLFRSGQGDGGSLVQLTQSAHDSEPHWSPDGRWIAFLSERKIAGKDGDSAGAGTDSAKEISQVFLISPNGGEAIPVTTGTEEVHSFSWSADSHAIYFASHAPWTKEQEDANKKEWKDTVRYRDGERGDSIYRLDIAGVLDRNVADPARETESGHEERNTPGAVLIASSPWRVNELASSPDGQRLAFLTTSISRRMERLDEFEVYAVDLGATLPATPRQLTHNQAFEQDLRWSADSKRVFFAVGNGNAEGSYSDTQEHLYAVDAATGQLQRWAGSFDGSITAYTVNNQGNIVAGGRLGTEVQLYNLPNAQAKAAKLPGWLGTYEHFSTAEHSPRIAFVYSSLDHPAEVYVADSAEKLAAAHPITSMNRLFTERALPQGKPYRWTSSDGMPVEGMLIYPPGKFQAKNLPLFVLIHGGPADADGNEFHADWYQWDKLAATNGWLVFEPNYRGSVGYGDKFAASIVPNLVSAPGKDILSGVNALVKDGIADPNRLTVGGYSYGGYMTNWLITQTTRFKAAVTGAGAVEHAANWGNDDMTLDDAHFLGGRPWEQPQRYVEEAALFHIDKVRTPTHMVGGAADIRVAVLEDYLLDHALHSLGVPSSLLIFPGEGHSLDKNPWHGKIKVREELKWLEKYGEMPAPQ
jgi:dipeptidyl aminopeptidase/acylaminoacyl peptidase